MSDQQQPTESDDAAVVGRNVAAARKGAGLSQTELADAMSERGHKAWRQTTVSRVEKGERPLRADELEDLRDMFPDGRLMSGTRLAREAGDFFASSNMLEMDRLIDEVSRSLDELRDYWSKYKRWEQRRQRDG